MTQTLEEAWGALELRQGDRPLADAVRALALAVLEEAVRDGGQGLGSSRLARRIKELGR